MAALLRTRRRFRGENRDPVQISAGDSLLEQSVQGGLGAVDFGAVLWGMGARLRLEVIAEVRLFFVADFLGGRLPTVLRIRRVVVDAQAADVQLHIAGLADVEAAQWQGQCGEGLAAFPADEGMRHCPEEGGVGRSARRLERRARFNPTEED